MLLRVMQRTASQLSMASGFRVRVSDFNVIQCWPDSAADCQALCVAAVQVRKSIVGFEPGPIKDYATALDAGFGSLYWMEGVVVRLQVLHKFARSRGLRCCSESRACAW